MKKMKISEAFFLRPWAVKQEMLVTMGEIVDRHMRGEKLGADEISARIGDGKIDGPGYEAVGDKAVIQIYGVIAKRMGLLQRISGGTSTMDIKASLAQALQDPNVKQIILDVDSPGGSVDGVAQLADAIFEARGKKEILCYADGQMCSAAYWIGSAADKLFATSTTEVGSIGVYAVVDDYTVAWHNRGIKTEVIKAGRYKAAGHPDKPFTAEDRNVIQEEVNTYYDLFVDAVARNRGMTREKAMDLADGRVYIGQKALDFDLIDGIGEIDNALAGSVPSGITSRARVESGDVNIEGGQKPKAQKPAQNNKPQEEAMELKDVTLEQLRTARPDLCNTLIAEGKVAGITEGKASGVTEGKAAGITEGRTAGVTEERKRALDIVKAANGEFKGKGVETLAEEAIEKGKTLDASLAAMRKKCLDDVTAAGNKGPGPDASSDAGKTHLERAKEYQKEHKCSLAEALSKTAEARKK